jgi:RNA polymerase sigma-70 factor (ECF subfamily)
LRAYEKMGRFDADRPFGPWFMKIIVNDAVKAARWRERTVPSGGGEHQDLLARIADSEAGPQGLLEEAETQRRVWEAMEKLPPAQRAAIVQRYYLGMSEVEMADYGDIPPGTIKWRLHAARKRLSKLLRTQLRAEAAPVTRERSAHELRTPEGGDDRG